MAVTATWEEYTTAGASITTGGTTITNTNWGSAVGVDLDASANPIAQGTFSFFNQQTLLVATITASETVQSPILWQSAGTVTSGDFLEVFDKADKVTVVPTATDQTGTTMPTSEGTAFAISGAGITSAPNAFNLFHTQINVSASTTSGASGIQLTLQYDVVA